MTDHIFIQAFFSLFILASMTLYLVLGGVIVEWHNRRKRRQRIKRRLGL